MDPAVLSEHIYYSLDAGGETRPIALDISKAFDKVWHSILLHKLKAYCVVGPILSILESFLPERSLKFLGPTLNSCFLLMIFLMRFYQE